MNEESSNLFFFDEVLKITYFIFRFLYCMQESIEKNLITNKINKYPTIKQLQTTILCGLNYNF